jgi:hypothetical protein
MARASLSKLLTNIITDIGSGKGGAEIYRKLKANKRVHFITLDAKDLEKQIKIEMYYREGIGGDKAEGFSDRDAAVTYQGISVFRTDAKGAAHGKDAKATLDEIIKRQAVRMVSDFWDKFKKMHKDRTNTRYFASAMKPEAKSNKFTFLYMVIEGKEVVNIKGKAVGYDVFKHFKSVKQVIQRDLIKELNEWSRVNSRRKEGLVEKLRYSRSSKTWKEVKVSKNIRTRGEGFIDIGHIEGASISHQRQGETKSQIEDYIEKEQGELWKLNLEEQGMALAFIKRMQDEITWTVGKYDNVQKDFDRTSVGLEAKTLNRAEGIKGESIALENQLQAFLAELGKKNDKDAWENAEGSDSMVTKITKKVKNALVKELKGNKNIKTRNLKHSKIKASKATATKTVKKPKITLGTIANIHTVDKTITRAMRRKKGQNVRKQATAAAAPLELLGLINKELPDTVRANMGAPALTNITGRFADSTKATDMHMTPQGFPSIGYTYQRNPYGTFEQDPDYDPRRLIDRSMREIAAQYAIGRFYTRRV